MIGGVFTQFNRYNGPNGERLDIQPQRAQSFRGEEEVIKTKILEVYR